MKKIPVMIFGPDPMPAYDGPKALSTARYLNRVYQMYVAVTGPDHFIVGWLSFDQHHQVATVDVRPEYRRIGIATALWDTAKADYPDLRHSDEMTPDGKAWVTSLGDWLPARAAKLIPPLVDPWHMPLSQLDRVLSKETA